jgi:serine O-acetyltransferase
MSIFSSLGTDIRAAMTRDPACRSKWEVIFSYPGFHAVVFYRFAHALWRHKFYFLGRFVSHLGRFFSGIEIHPGATIGDGFFIDHGMGVVIGETAEIGNDVTLYQGVTLGGTSLEKGKRHPTLKDNVIVGAGAKVLGPLTLGEGSRVGSNSVVLKDVAEHTTVVGAPAKPARGAKDTSDDFRSYGTSGEMPDPVARSIEGLLNTMDGLSNRIKVLEKELAAREADIASLMKCRDENQENRDVEQ